MTGPVLHVDTSAEWRGGQQQVHLLHRELLRRGVSSRVLARGELARRLRGEGLAVTALAGRRPWAPRVLAALMANVAGVGVVHAHESHAATLGVVAKALRPGIRLVCHRRVSYGLKRAGAARWRYRRPDAWIAVSGEIQTILVEAGVPPGKIRVIHSAVDVEAFRSEAAATDTARLRGDLGIAPQAPIVGFCGAFSPQKGHGILLEAVPAILAARPDAVFLLPGEGELFSEVRDRVRGAGLGGSVILPGFRTDVAALTSLFAVGAVPSVDGEGSSASIKEPMVLGSPVVVSDLAGNLEVMADGGLAFRNRVAEDLAGAVVRLLNEPGLRAELGRRARRRAEAFSVGAMAEATLSVYGVLGSAGPGLTGLAGVSVGSDPSGPHRDRSSGA